jgi:hypothetical protein
VRPLRYLVPVAVTAMLVAGCGSTSTTSGSGGPATTTAAPVENGVDKLSATEILAKAKAALPKAKSVHVSGSSSGDGEELRLDLRVNGTAGGQGTIVTGNNRIEVIRIGQTVYLKADGEALSGLAGNPEAAKLLAGKYLKGSATDPKLKDLAAFTSLTEMATNFLEPTGKITKGERKVVRGVPAIGLVDNAKDGGVMYIALRGEPLPLQLAPLANSKEQGTLDFLDYGKPVEVTQPPAAQVVDLDKLGGN